MNKKPYPVGPGWWPLLDEKLPEIKALTDEVHVREKYGSCHVGYPLCNKEHELLIKLSDLSREIEKASTHICENCGAPRKSPAKWYPWCDRCKSASHELRKLIRTKTAAKYWRGKEKGMDIRELQDKKMLDEFDEFLDQQEEKEPENNRKAGDLKCNE